MKGHKRNKSTRDAIKSKKFAKAFGSLSKVIPWETCERMSQVSFVIHKIYMIDFSLMHRYMHGLT